MSMNVARIGPTKRSSGDYSVNRSTEENVMKGIANHPVEFRRCLAILACEPGVSVARLAMEHGVNTNLLFK